MLAKRVRRKGTAAVKLRSGKEVESFEDIQKRKAKELQCKREVFLEWRAAIQESSTKKRRLQVMLARKRREEAALREREMIRLINKVVFDTWRNKARMWRRQREQRLKQETILQLLAGTECQGNPSNIKQSVTQSRHSSSPSFTRQPSFKWPPQDRLDQRQQSQPVLQKQTTFVFKDRFTEKLHRSIWSRKSKNRLDHRHRFEHNKEHRLDSKKAKDKELDEKHRMEVESIMHKVKQLTQDSEEPCTLPMDASFASTATFERGAPEIRGHEPVPGLGSRLPSETDTLPFEGHTGHASWMMLSTVPVPPSTGRARNLNGNEPRSRQQNLRKAYSTLMVDGMKKSSPLGGRMLKKATSMREKTTSTSPWQEDFPSPSPPKTPRPPGYESILAPSVTIEKSGTQLPELRKESEERQPQTTPIKNPKAALKKKGHKKKQTVHVKLKKAKSDYGAVMGTNNNNERPSRMQDLMPSTTSPRLSTAKLRKLRQQDSAQQMMAVYQIFVK